MAHPWSKTLRTLPHPPTSSLGRNGHTPRNNTASSRLPPSDAITARTPHSSGESYDAATAIIKALPFKSPVATGHAFHGEYSIRFREGADDITECPNCSSFYSARHALERCDERREEHHSLLNNLSLTQLTTTTAGGVALVLFIHQTQGLLRPLTGPWNPPPDPETDDNENPAEPPGPP